MNQRVGIEELREGSIAKMAALMLPGLAPVYIKYLSEGEGVERARRALINECLLIAGQFQAKAEKRCEDARRRDSLAGNT